MASSLFVGPRLELEPESVAQPPAQRANRGFQILRIALGMFLLATAGLKAHGLTIDPLAQDSFLASPGLLVASIEIEIILGLWLLSGWSARAAWVVALGFFSILAVTSFFLGLEGQTSCGCFGRVTVNPWVTFGLDLGILVAVFLWRPVNITKAASLESCRVLLKTGGGVLVFLLMIWGGFVLLVRDPAEALARLRGDSITLQPTIGDVGEASVGEERMFPVQVTNRTDHPVRIIGGTSTCSCFATLSLPLTLSGGESQEIEVWVKYRGSPGRFTHPYLLYTDDDKQSVIVGRFAGRVIDSSE